MPNHDPEPIKWAYTQTLPARRYVCGFCGIFCRSFTGYLATSADQVGVYLCYNCGEPTYFNGDKQVPDTAYGAPIQHLPADLEALYSEARNCMAVSSFTAAAMLGRKILMHVAVQLGASEGQHFAPYVNWLLANGHIAVGSHPWVDHIRAKGNEANHEITITSREEAETLLLFVEMFLKTTFDYPQRVRLAKAP